MRRSAAASRASCSVALHHRNRVQHLGGDRARVGHAVLAGAREPAHAAAEPERRQHDQHQDAEHLRHHYRVGDDQHGHRADAHHRVAQAHRQARADHGLHQRRVGRQARQHLAGLRGLEELRALAHDVRIDGVAQVGGDALAEPADHVEARRREQAERDADARTARRSARAAPSRCVPGSRPTKPSSIRLRSATGKTSVLAAASTRNRPASAIRPR